MNNIQQKTTLNSLEKNINLPYQKLSHINHAYSNYGIDMFDINNSMNQLLDNDLYIQNYFNETSGYVNGPKSSKVTDVDAGVNGYKSYGDIKTSDGIEIFKKVETPLSDTVEQIVTGDVTFVVGYGDMTYIGFRNKTLKYSSDVLTSQLSTLGNGVTAYSYYKDENHLFFGCTNGVYELSTYIDLSYNNDGTESDTYGQIVKSIRKLNSNAMQNITSITFDKKHNTIIAANSSQIYEGTYNATKNINFKPSIIDSYKEESFENPGIKVAYSVYDKDTIAIAPVNENNSAVFKPIEVEGIMPSYTDIGYYLSSVATFSNLIFIIQDNDVYAINSTTYEKTLISGTTGDIISIVSSNKCVFAATIDTIYKIDSSLSAIPIFYKKINDINIDGIISLIKLDNYKFIITANSGTYIANIINDSIFVDTIKVEGNILSNVYAAAIQQSDRFLIGGLSGLYSFTATNTNNVEVYDSIQQIEEYKNKNIVKILNVKDNIVVVTTSSVFMKDTSDMQLDFDETIVDATYDSYSQAIVVLHRNAISIVEINGNRPIVIIDKCKLYDSETQLTCNANPYLAIADNTIAFISNNDKCYWISINSIQTQTTGHISCHNINISNVSNIQSDGQQFYVLYTDNNQKKINTYSQVGTLNECKQYDFQPYSIYDLEQLNSSILIGNDGIHAYHISTDEDESEYYSVSSDVINIEGLSNTYLSYLSGTSYTLYIANGRALASLPISGSIDNDNALTISQIVDDESEETNINIEFILTSNDSITKLLPGNDESVILYFGTTNGLYKYVNGNAIRQTKSFTNDSMYITDNENQTLMLMKHGTNIVSSDLNFNNSAIQNIYTCNEDSSFKVVNARYSQYAILDGRLSTIYDETIANTSITGINDVLVLDNNEYLNVLYVKDKNIVLKKNDTYNSSTDSYVINTQEDNTCNRQIFNTASSDKITKIAIEQGNYNNPRIFFSSKLSSDSLFYLDCSCNSSGKISSISSFDYNNGLRFTNCTIEKIYSDNQNIIVFISSLTNNSKKIAIIDPSQPDIIQTYVLGIRSVIQANDGTIYYSTDNSKFIRNIYNDNEHYNINLYGQILNGIAKIDDFVNIATSTNLIQILTKNVIKLKDSYCNSIAMNSQYTYILNDDHKIEQYSNNDFTTALNISTRQYSNIYCQHDYLYAVSLDKHSIYQTDSNVTDLEMSLEFQSSSYTVVNMLNRQQLQYSFQAIDVEYGNLDDTYDYPYIVCYNDNETYKVYSIEFTGENIRRNLTTNCNNTINSIIVTENTPLTQIGQSNSLASNKIILYKNNLNLWSFINGSILPTNNIGNNIDVKSMCCINDNIYISDSTSIYQLIKNIHTKTTIEYLNKISNIVPTTIYQHGNYFTAIIYKNGDFRQIAILNGLTITQPCLTLTIDSLPINSFSNVCISNKTIFISNGDDAYYSMFTSSLQDLELLELKGYSSNFIFAGNYSTGEIFIDEDGLYLYPSIEKITCYIENDDFSRINIVNNVLQEDDRILIFTRNGIQSYQDGIMLTVKNSSKCFLDCQKTGFGEYSYVLIDQLGDVYATSNMKIFKKIFSINDSTQTASIYPKNNHTYIVGTNDGLYSTQYQYSQVLDVKTITYDKTIQYYNEEFNRENGISSTVSNVISNHISTMHLSDSIITKLNRDYVDISASNVISSWQTNNNIESALVFKNDIVDDIYFGNYGDGDVDVQISNFLCQTNEYFNSTDLSYIIKRYSSGITEVYINIPTTHTYYLSEIYGAAGCFTSNSLVRERKNLKDFGESTSLQDSIISKHYTDISVALANAEFNIDNILDIQINGTSLPLQIYKGYDEDDDDDDTTNYLFNSFIQPSIVKKYDISNITDDGNYIFNFSCFGTDEQSIKIMFYDSKHKEHQNIKVIFKPNGASGTAYAQKFRILDDGSIEQKRLKKNMFEYVNSSNGYRIFNGWSLHKNSSNDSLENQTIYADAQIFPNGNVLDEILTEFQKSDNYEFKDGDEIVLYANWVDYEFESDDSHIALASNQSAFSIDSVGVDTSVKPGEKVIISYN